LTNLLGSSSIGGTGGILSLREAIFSLQLLHNGASRDDAIGPCHLTWMEGRMSPDLQILEEWIPERMDPGTIFVLENKTKVGPEQAPYVAVMSCPRCGSMGLITRRQLCDGEPMICGGDACSAEYLLDGETINYRRAQ